MTRSELCYVVHILSQFMREPMEEHMDVVHRVSQYLKGTPGYGILLVSDCDLQIYAYCDAN